MQKEFKYSMNTLAKDCISGFTGVIITRSAHLFGCAQYGLAPQELSTDGTPRKTEHFDEARIEIIDTSNVLNEDNSYDDIFAIKLGTEVKDKVSNFEGKVLLITENMNNCSQYYVEPTVDKDGKTRDGNWFDEGRLEVIGEGILPSEDASTKRGSVFSRDLPDAR